jgi:hypothetical protein
MQTKISLWMLIIAFLSACTEDTNSLVSSDHFKGNPVGSTNTTTSALAGTSTLSFAGYTWNVRDNTVLQGPGPNYFSNANAWVDTNGYLHLKLALNPSNGRWECAEVTSDQLLGNGTYQWKIEGPINALDKNVVLGMFNYSGNDGFDEQDIEISKWGKQGNKNVLNYTVWPATGSTIPHVEVTYPLPRSGTSSTTHRFTRTASNIVFKSMLGFQDDDTNLFATKSWTSPPTSISTTPMPVYMNLWAFHGVSPGDGKPVEIIIHDFKFTPLP